MAWPKLLVFVRHAESVGNTMTADERADFAIGTHDYALTPRGRRQALITGLWLNKEFGSFDVYYTSYYRRSKETMELMYPDVKIYEDPRLAEAQRGIWHVMTKEQIQKTFPLEIERKEREGLYHHRPLGGENQPDVELRIHSFDSTLNRDYEGQSVLIVCHGHWLILQQRLIHHFPIEEALRRYHEAAAENASVTVYEGKEISGKSRLVLNPKYDNFVPWKGLL